MAKREENGFDMLARLIKEEGEDIRAELGGKIDAVEESLDRRIDGLEKKVDEGFARIDRRLDAIVQPQLDEHAHRIKKLETAVFSK